MSAPARAAAALLAARLAAAVPGRGAAFERTTDRSTGRAIAWPTPVVAYHVNDAWPAGNTAPSCQGGAALSAVQAAHAAWEQDCTDLRLVFGGTVGETAVGLRGSGENLVVFRRGWCSQVVPPGDPCLGSADLDCGPKYECFEDGCRRDDPSCDAWSTLAQTTVLYDPDTGRIFDADIEVNGWDGAAGPLTDVVRGQFPPHGWYYTCFEPAQPEPECTTYGQDACHYLDLRNVVTHEVGHVIGLAHVGLPSAVMYRSSGPGDVAKRQLSADDRDGVCAIYPRAERGGCGCGGGEGATALSLLLAGLAVRRRPPPRSPPPAGRRR